MLVVFEEVTGVIRSALIADLRFIPNFSLIPLEPGQMSDDPDTYAEMQKTIEESLAIEAFVAPEPARKISKNAEELVTRYFGPFDFYPSLEVLEQYGDKLAEQEAQIQKKQSAKQNKKNLLPRNK